MSKTALITGANRGLGLQTAKELAARGFHVVMGARDPAKGQNAAANLGSNVTVLTIDVSDSASVSAAARQFSSQFSSLDVLVNNAGIYLDLGVSILDVARDKLVKTFQTNTFGAIAVAQAFLPFLRRAAGGRIINVSSGYGQLDRLSPSVPSYCLSKLALHGVTLMLSRALEADHISVNAVCPGWVRTDMGGPHADRSVEEGADTIIWLATEAPATLTGKLLRDRQEIPW